MELLQQSQSARAKVFIKASAHEQNLGTLESRKLGRVVNGSEKIKLTEVRKCNRVNHSFAKSAKKFASSPKTWKSTNNKYWGKAIENNMKTKQYENFRDFRIEILPQQKKT